MVRQNGSEENKAQSPSEKGKIPSYPPYSKSLAGEALSELPDIRHAWRIFKIHKYLIMTITLVLAVCTGVISLFTPPEYVAQAIIGPTTAHFEALDGGIHVDVNNEFSDKIVNLTQYFQSPYMGRSILREILKRNGGSVPLPPRGFNKILVFFGIKKPQTIADAFNQSDSTEDVIRTLREHIQITADIIHNNIIVEGRAPTSAGAAILANTAADVLVAQNHKNLLKKVKDLKVFLQGQTEELGSKLDQLETQLVQFQRDNKLLSGTEAEQSLYGTMIKNNEYMTTVKVKYLTTKKTVESVENEIKQAQKMLLDPKLSGTNMYLNQLQHRLSMLQYQQEVNGGGNQSPDDPINKELAQVTGEYKDALEKNVNSQVFTVMTPLEYIQDLEKSLAALKKNEKELGSELNGIDSEINRNYLQLGHLSGNLKKLNGLQRDINLTTDLYVNLRKKLQEAQIQEASTLNDLTVITAASSPAKPSNFPTRLKVICAMILGLIFSIGIILVKESLLPTVRNRHDLEDVSLPVIAELPEIDLVYDNESSAGGGLKKTLLQSFEEFARPRRPFLVLEKIPSSYEANVFRRMRVRLTTLAKKMGQFGEHGPRVMLFTSPVANCGKSFVSVNFATILANAEHKTLLIDLDLRNPSVRQFFINKKNTGIDKKVTKDSTNFDDMITRNVFPNLDVLFSNQYSDPAELLDSKFLPQLLTHVRNKYDYVLIDSPPVLGVIDPIIISEHVDAAILIIKHRKTFREDVLSTVEKIGEAHPLPLFGVLNLVHREFSHEYYYRYQMHATRADRVKRLAKSLSSKLPFNKRSA